MSGDHIDATQKAVSALIDEQKAGLKQAIVAELRHYGCVVDGDWGSAMTPAELTVWRTQEHDKAQAAKGPVITAGSAALPVILSSNSSSSGRGL